MAFFKSKSKLGAAIAKASEKRSAKGKKETTDHRGYRQTALFKVQRKKKRDAAKAERVAKRTKKKASRTKAKSEGKSEESKAVSRKDKWKEMIAGFKADRKAKKGKKRRGFSKKT